MAQFFQFAQEKVGKGAVGRERFFNPFPTGHRATPKPPSRTASTGDWIAFIVAQLQSDGKLYELFDAFLEDQGVPVQHRRASSSALQLRVAGIRAGFYFDNTDPFERLDALSAKVALNPQAPLDKEARLQSVQQHTLPGQLRARVRPLRPGYSIGGKKVAPGTLGGFLRGNSPKRYILSNVHVLCSDVASLSRNPVVQPASGDGGYQAVGTVVSARLIVAHGDNPMDAAIAELNDDIEIDVTYGRMGAVAGARHPKVGETVFLVGRSSGYVEGVVDKLSQRVDNLHADVGKTIVANYVDVVQIRCRDRLWTNKPGDSGSLWIAKSDRHAVALQFAGAGGNADADRSAVGYPLAYASPILPILIHFQSALSDPSLGLIGEDGAIHTGSVSYPAVWQPGQANPPDEWRQKVSVPYTAGGAFRVNFADSVQKLSTAMNLRVIIFGPRESWTAALSQEVEAEVYRARAAGYIRIHISKTFFEHGTTHVRVYEWF